MRAHQDIPTVIDFDVLLFAPLQVDQMILSFSLQILTMIEHNCRAMILSCDDLVNFITFQLEKLLVQMSTCLIINEYDSINDIVTCSNQILGQY